MIVTTSDDGEHHGARLVCQILYLCLSTLLSSNVVPVAAEWYRTGLRVCHDLKVEWLSWLISTGCFYQWEINWHPQCSGSEYKSTLPVWTQCWIYHWKCISVFSKLRAAGDISSKTSWYSPSDKLTVDSIFGNFCFPKQTLPLLCKVCVWMWTEAIP